MTLQEKIDEVQQKLIVPKERGGDKCHFKYRSTEDLKKAIKPLAHALKLLVTVSDDVRLVGDYVYIISTAEATDTETGDTKRVTATARDAIENKGMVAPQVTGTASSYAQKRALGGLFMVDDDTDADAMIDDYCIEISDKCKQNNINMEAFLYFLFGVHTLKELSFDRLEATALRFDAACAKYKASKEEIPMP